MMGTKLKKLFTSVLVLGAFLFIAFGSLDDEVESNKHIEEFSYSKGEAWWKGGTLHQATIKEWQNATYENKLATCGEFIVKLNSSSSVLVVEKSKESQFRDMSEKLVVCANAATKDLEVYQEGKISRVIANCAIGLGYLESL